jgi:hypothetical protein
LGRNCPPSPELEYIEECSDDHQFVISDEAPFPPYKAQASMAIFTDGMAYQDLCDQSMDKELSWLNSRDILSSGFNSGLPAPAFDEAITGC